jgi:superfamily I DNA/RNA helicase
MARSGDLKYTRIRASLLSRPTIIKLEQNYRSTNAILGVANSVIRRNPRRRPKSLWSENGDGDRIRVLQVPDDEEEANFVTERDSKASVI